MQAATAPKLEPPCILVVEDEPLVRFPLAEALREIGATVAEAASGDEAWALLQAGTDVDLVFTDHRMPGSMTGVQLADRIRQHFPDIPVLITSGFMGSKAQEVRIISKPYDVLEISRLLVDTALNARRNRTGA